MVELYRFLTFVGTSHPDEVHKFGRIPRVTRIARQAQTRGFETRTRSSLRPEYQSIQQECGPKMLDRIEFHRAGSSRKPRR